MSTHKGRGQAITGQQTCECDCRQCHFGYHCATCADLHREAVAGRGHITGRRDREAPPAGRNTANATKRKDQA